MLINTGLRARDQVWGVSEQDWRGAGDQRLVSNSGRSCQVVTVRWWCQLWHRVIGCSDCSLCDTSLTMSIASVSSFSFHKPKSIYASIRKSDYSIFRKSGPAVSDDNIFGRERQSYVYDTPRQLLPRTRDVATVRPTKVRGKEKLHHSGSSEKPTNLRKNGSHCCQDAEKIKRSQKVEH